MTCNANDHTKADAAGLVPDRDALAFANAESLMLVDSDLRPRSDNAVTVAVAPETDGANTIRLSAGFTSGGGPVVPAAGDVLVYPHYAGGSVPNAAWSTRMKTHVAQADDADNLLPNDDVAYVYGT